MKILMTVSWIYACYDTNFKRMAYRVCVLMKVVFKFQFKSETSFKGQHKLLRILHFESF